MKRAGLVLAVAALAMWAVLLVQAERSVFALVPILDEVWYLDPEPTSQERLIRDLMAEVDLNTLEIDPKRADDTRANLAKVGLDKTVTCITGDALKTLAGLEGEFDFGSIDADVIVVVGAP